jgi:hypothetical protein
MQNPSRIWPLLYLHTEWKRVFAYTTPRTLIIFAQTPIPSKPHTRTRRSIRWKSGDLLFPPIAPGVEIWQRQNANRATLSISHTYTTFVSVTIYCVWLHWVWQWAAVRLIRCKLCWTPMQKFHPTTKQRDLLSLFEQQIHIPYSSLLYSCITCLAGLTKS